MARIDTLANFLTDVATAIKNKTGKTDAITPANFDTEINSIEASGVNINNAKDLENYLYEGADIFNNYIKNIPNTYETYTSNPITLYAPVETHTKYIIRKRGADQYGIVWFPATYDAIAVQNSAFGPAKISIGVGLITQGVTPVPSVKGYTESALGYMSSTMSTVEACITALQDPTTTYSTSSNSSWGFQTDGDYMVPYTNMACFTDTDCTEGLSRKISTAETITVVSTE